MFYEQYMINFVAAFSILLRSESIS